MVDREPSGSIEQGNQEQHAPQQVILATEVEQQRPPAFDVFDGPSDARQESGCAVARSVMSLSLPFGGCAQAGAAQQPDGDEAPQGCAEIEIRNRFDRPARRLA